MDQRCRTAFLTGIILLSCGGPARAVIKVDMPVYRMFQTAKAVAVGTITRVNPDNRVIEVRMADTLKGDPVGEQVRIQLAAQAELLANTSPGQPVAILVGKAKGGSVAVVHLADAWLLAELVPTVSPPAWRVTGPHSDGRLSFPGRTVALVRLLADLKSGKNSILDEVEQNVLHGGVKELGKLNVSKPAWMLAADVNGDRKPDILIGTADGTRLFLAAGDGYKDVTDIWGKWGAAGAYRAVGDINGDGRADLLLNDTLWVNEGGRFALAGATLTRSPSKVRPLAAALADVTGDSLPDAVLLSASGELQVFENPGAVDKPWPSQKPRNLWTADAPVTAFFGDWGDTGRIHLLAIRETGITRYALGADEGPPADYERLTGARLDAHVKAFSAGLKNPTATALDVNGDGRMDLLLAAENGGLLLVNRGLGAFLVNPDAAAPLVDPKGPFNLSAGAIMTAADLHGDQWDDLLVLTGDGRLYLVDNPPIPGPDSKGSP